MTDATGYRAWCESLPPEQQARALPSIGDSYSLIALAVTKRILADEKLRPVERLDFLERLNSLDGGYIDVETLGAVGPASDIELQIFVEAASLDSNGARCDASYRVLTKPEVFSLFVDANPTLFAAIKAKAGRAHAGQ